MKKAIIAALVMALALAASCAAAEPADWHGQTIPDFSVRTIDGGTFTLSESLRTHDLVMINLWATWCGPCRSEFPYLETAWERYGSRVDVIALSIESTDTLDVLRNFASQYGLRFAIGRDEANLFGLLNGNAIPTSLIVDGQRRIVWAEVGSQPSVEAFTAIFDSLLDQYGSTPAPAARERCVLYFRDPAGNPIPGVTVGFCNGEYWPTETDGAGRVAFEGSAADYHLHLLSVPDGYALPWEEMHIYGGDSYELTVTLYPN